MLSMPLGVNNSAIVADIEIQNESKIIFSGLLCGYKIKKQMMNVDTKNANVPIAVFPNTKCLDFHFFQ